MFYFLRKAHFSNSPKFTQLDEKIENLTKILGSRQKNLNKIETKLKMLENSVKNYELRKDGKLMNEEEEVMKVCFFFSYHEQNFL